MTSPLRPASLLFLLSVSLSTVPALADEGMWTLDRFPSDRVGAKYAFTPTPEWLEHVRLSSARLADGCSGSFVSGDGLVMTNHHCAHSCIEQISTAKRDYVASGFYAATAEQEVRCPEIEINQLVGIDDVTAEVEKATAGTEGDAYVAARKAVIARLEKACARGDDLRCDVVSLYHGGKYHLYTYRRYQDVRLVFAPEFAIAFFGGDPDNFEFPRYDLDVAFLRVWRNGRPARMDHWFQWSPSGVKEGELTFVSGHPGSTSRLRAVAELEFERDFELIESLLYRTELRGMLTEFQKRGAEQRRTSSAQLFYVENSIKARHGMLRALLDPELLRRKAADERDLRARLAADPSLRDRYAGAWEEIARAVAAQRIQAERYWYLEDGWGFRSDLFTHARRLVRLADEALVPNEKRLEEYGEARLPELRQQIGSEAPIHADVEIATLSFSLGKLRAELGPDDPFVRRVLGLESPEEVATKLVRGTRLGRADVRR